jgi:hypothetical protein
MPTPDVYHIRTIVDTGFYKWKRRARLHDQYKDVEVTCVMTYPHGTRGRRRSHLRNDLPPWNEGASSVGRPH